jgi:mutator protein MutT
MNAQPTPIAIAVVRHGDRYLIGQRREEVALAGLWEFPGGKVHPGETPAEAAARECFEETGLQVDVGEPYSQVVHRYDHDRLHLHFFASTPRDPAAAPKKPFRWVSAAELSRYEFPAANQALVARLIAGTAGS